MTYILLLHCLHPYLLQLSFVIILIMSLFLKYNTFYLLAEITLKHGLQSTEEYFPYIAYAFFVFLLCKKECSI